jgi:hypothetical protein
MSENSPCGPPCHQSDEPRLDGHVPQALVAEEGFQAMLSHCNILSEDEQHRISHRRSEIPIPSAGMSENSI